MEARSSRSEPALEKNKMKISLANIPREKLKLWILFALLGFIAAIAVSLWYVAPTLNKKKALIRDIYQKGEQLRKEERVVGKKEKLQESVAKLKSRLEEISQDAPRTKGPTSMLSILSLKSDETKIIYNRIEPREVPEGEAEKIPGFMPRDFILQFQAGYHQLGGFLNVLENTSSLIEILDLKISGVKEKPYTHDITVIVRAYRKQ